MHVCAWTRPRARVPTCTHSRTRKHAHTDQYVLLIAFPQQQWLRERASVLRYTYIACLVYLWFHMVLVINHLYILLRVLTNLCLQN